MPVLIITPDISAETWLGAAGCASGSQTCSGTNPALVPKPTSASTNSAPARAARARRRRRTMRKAVPTWVAIR